MPQAHSAQISLPHMGDNNFANNLTLKPFSNPSLFRISICNILYHLVYL